MLIPISNGVTPEGRELIATGSYRGSPCANAKRVGTIFCSVVAATGVVGMLTSFAVGNCLIPPNNPNFVWVERAAYAGFALLAGGGVGAIVSIFSPYRRCAG